MHGALRPCVGFICEGAACAAPVLGAGSLRRGCPPSLGCRWSVHAPLPRARSRYAAALLGLSNTAGALPGVLGVTAAGYLLDKTGSWAHALFLPTAACQVVGLIVYSIFASSKRQGWDEDEAAA